jgi:hypothetical protein
MSSFGPPAATYERNHESVRFFTIAVPLPSHGDTTLFGNEIAAGFINFERGDTFTVRAILRFSACAKPFAKPDSETTRSPAGRDASAMAAALGEVVEVILTNGIAAERSAEIIQVGDSAWANA